ncbi:hypothetical protein JCM19037_1378 [Geomicrobium sp. JCM 19037]|uniref:S-layer homology domain-containing protein n=1 Tax=Geomicrobium sp. JCM 19037 TaxID=1460634 RepID=UPI00045F185B|nr:S-layer homology domain-containing protein [Geomicrobium sp. JCM 19037]GAK03090.1 hypothetical protein JCM19037_1378 [Geomicrobium sp. JCM 19037]
MSYKPRSYRKFLAGTVTAAMAATAFTVTTPAQVADAEEGAVFSDVTPSTFGYTEILRNAERGIISGYSDGTFRPGETINRGQTANLLVDALGFDRGDVGDVPFDDLSDDHVYAEAATIMQEEGIMVGRFDGTMFDAGNGISREQMASVLVRAFGLENTGEDTNLVDLDDAYSAHRENIEILTQHGISSVESGEFRPGETVTRSAFAVFLDRALIHQYTQESDITGIEAVNNTTVDVHFDVAQPEVDAMNFTFDGLETLDVDIIDDGYTVRVTTSEQEEGTEYSFWYGESPTTLTFTGVAEADEPDPDPEPEPEPEPGTIEAAIADLQAAYADEDDVEFLGALNEIYEFDHDDLSAEVFAEYVTAYMDAYDGESSVSDIDSWVSRVNLDTTLVMIEAGDEDDLLQALNRLGQVSDFEYAPITGIEDLDRYVEQITALDFDSPDIIDHIQETVERLNIELLIEGLHDMDDLEEDMIPREVTRGLLELSELTGAFEKQLILPYRAEQYREAFADDDYPTGTVEDIVAMLEDINAGDTMPDIEITIDSVDEYDYRLEELTFSGTISEWDIEWPMSFIPELGDEDGGMLDEPHGGAGMTMHEDGEFVGMIDMERIEESGMFTVILNNDWLMKRCRSRSTSTLNPV